MQLNNIIAIFILLFFTLYYQWDNIHLLFQKRVKIENSKDKRKIKRLQYQIQLYEDMLDSLEKIN